MAIGEEVVKAPCNSSLKLPFFAKSTSVLMVEVHIEKFVCYILQVSCETQNWIIYVVNAAFVLYNTNGWIN